MNYFKFLKCFINNFNLNRVRRTIKVINSIFEFFNPSKWFLILILNLLVFRDFSDYLDD
jgi:hypothetical protein